MILVETWMHDTMRECKLCFNGKACLTGPVEFSKGVCRDLEKACCNVVCISERHWAGFCAKGS